MRVETEIKKWGNSLALRVTGLMAEQEVGQQPGVAGHRPHELPQFEPGTRVTVDIDSEGFVVRRAAGSFRPFRFPESESALLEGITAQNAHTDLLAVPIRRELGM